MKAPHASFEEERMKAKSDPLDAFETLSLQWEVYESKS